MNYHVYPLKDIAPHNTDSDICPCNPTIQDGLVIHNSFDKREVVEMNQESWERFARAWIKKTEKRIEKLEQIAKENNKYWEFAKVESKK